jgi:hypothetical protein
MRMSEQLTRGLTVLSKDALLSTGALRFLPADTEDEDFFCEDLGSAAAFGGVDLLLMGVKESVRERSSEILRERMCLRRSQGFRWRVGARRSEGDFASTRLALLP